MVSGHTSMAQARLPVKVLYIKHSVSGEVRTSDFPITTILPLAIAHLIVSSVQCLIKNILHTVLEFRKTFDLQSHYEHFTLFLLYESLG